MLLRVGEFDGVKDDSLEGRQRRLDSFRASVRHRDGLGRRTHVHNPLFRAAAIAKLKMLRAEVRRR